METMSISEQDIVNALCIHLADKKGVAPQEIQIELLYDDDYGFSAEAYVGNRKQILIEANIIEALRFWIETELKENPYGSLRLALDEEAGIIAHYQS
ncbi:YxcD family protein [Sporolactobacillus shoreicorticis]|uniref:YxcD family protein n=1 Tax=Sporolactobacillus shoreicorticis TaxID=1923877 RepID=A0ABW5S181_9BACL|nr:YxcD family protein [Sporolactobacillus shoreicorticis]MCO7126820.1 YxcD family protein [Sporolactobacillus shoreicorticis]